ncbi:hypothetical protein ABG067_006807 [Albugo candida]
MVQLIWTERYTEYVEYLAKTWIDPHKEKSFEHGRPTPRGDIFEHIDRKISFYALRKVFEQIIADYASRRLCVVKKGNLHRQWSSNYLDGAIS